MNVAVTKGFTELDILFLKIPPVTKRTTRLDALETVFMTSLC